jgi:hypothetical protein
LGISFQKWIWTFSWEYLFRNGTECSVGNTFSLM